MFLCQFWPFLDPKIEVWFFTTLRYLPAPRFGKIPDFLRFFFLQPSLSLLLSFLSLLVNSSVLHHNGTDAIFYPSAEDWRLRTAEWGLRTQESLLGITGENLLGEYLRGIRWRRIFLEDFPQQKIMVELEIYPKSSILLLFILKERKGWRRRGKKVNKSVGR